MKLLIGIVFVIVLISWNVALCESGRNQNVIDLTDSLKFNESNFRIVFNDYNLFDTTFVFEQYVGFCGSGSDLTKNFIQPRFSNKKFNNNDSTRFGIEPKDDSLLFLNFYWQFFNGSTPETLPKLEFENRSRMATRRNPYSKALFHELTFCGVHVCIFGGESTGNPRTVKLEIYTSIGAKKITAHFQYVGNRTYNYLEKFCDIAKSMRVIKEMK